jgi:phage-related protein
MALVDGLIVALPILIEYIPEIVQAIFDALILALPLIGDAAVKIVLALIEGISKMMPKIGEAAGKLIVVLGQGIGNLRSKILEVGKNIVLGVWEGIKGRYTWFRDQVFSFFSGIVKGIKTALGIKSPSTVFAGIGENLALGLGVGFTDAISGVKNEINGVVNGMRNVDIKGTLSGQPASMLQPAPVYVTVQANVNQGVDYYRLAHRIGEELSRRRR